MDRSRILVPYTSLNEKASCERSLGVVVRHDNCDCQKLLRLVQTCAIAFCVFWVGAAAQAAPAKKDARCRSVCITVTSTAGVSGKRGVTVDIENRSNKDVRVAELGLILYSSTDAVRPQKHETMYFTPVNIELGIPIYPLPDGAFPESSLVLAPEHSIHWQLKLADLRWAKAKEKPIHYGDWNSIVQEGAYLLRAGVTADSHEIKSEPIFISKTTSPSPVGSVH